MTTALDLDATRRLLDGPPPPAVPGQLAVDAEPPRCEHGNPRCGAVPVRPYPCGYRCAEHQPARTHPYRTTP